MRTLAQECYCIYVRDFTYRDKDGNTRPGDRAFRYGLISSDGKVPSYAEKDLIFAIREGKVDVKNLYITENETIEVKNVNKQNDTLSINKAAKLRLMGFTVSDLETPCRHTIYLATKETRNILIIPDDVLNIGNFKESSLSSIKGSLEIIGGHGLLSTTDMLMDVRLNTLNLVGFTPVNVICADGMFKSAHINEIILGENESNRFSKLLSTSEMFAFAELPAIDFRRLLGNRLIDARGMFMDAKIFGTNSIIDLRGMDMSCVDSIDTMFNRAEVNKIILDDLHFPKVEGIDRAFSYLKAEALSLRNIKFGSLRFTNLLFSASEIHELNIENIDFSGLENCDYLFYASDIEMVNAKGFKLDTNSTLKEAFSVKRLVLSTDKENSEVIDLFRRNGFIVCNMEDDSDNIVLKREGWS